MKTVEITTCNNCDGNQSTPIARSMDFEFHTSEVEFVFVRCDACGLVYLRNRPDLSELGRIYSSEGTHYYEYDEYLGPWISRVRGMVQRQKLAPFRPFLGSGDLLVDVGCANAQLLRSVQRFGDPEWKLMGIDVASESIACLEGLGIPSRLGRFETLEWEGARPKVLVLNQVIEHLEDPSRVVERAFELLEPGGALVLETPSVDGWDAKLFRRRHWGGWHVPRHWILYNQDTLGALLRKHGFEIVETTYLLSTWCWLQSLRFWLRERGWPRLAERSQVNFLPALAVAAGVDIVQKALRGRTSNFRMVGRKPEARAASGAALV